MIYPQSYMLTRSLISFIFYISLFTLYFLMLYFSHSISHALFCMLSYASFLLFLLFLLIKCDDLSRVEDQLLIKCELDRLV